MRLVTKRLLLYTVTAVFVLYVIIKLHKTDGGRKNLDANCRVPLATSENLRLLMTTTHRILDQLKLTHFLCYGTLWGVLKMEAVLPWEDNVEFCAFNEELSKFEEAYLIRIFRKHNLMLRYDSQDGVYHVFQSTDVSGKGTLQIIVYEKDDNLDMMKRVGWSRRVLPPDCEVSSSLQCFPPRLVETPLATAVIDGTQYNVPREEIEIQKYLYPDTWWKDIKPKQC